MYDVFDRAVVKTVQFIPCMLRLLFQFETCLSVTLLAALPCHLWWHLKNVHGVQVLKYHTDIPPNPCNHFPDPRLKFPQKVSFPGTRQAHCWLNIFKYHMYEHLSSIRNGDLVCQCLTKAWNLCLLLQNNLCYMYECCICLRLWASCFVCSCLTLCMILINKVRKPYIVKLCKIYMKLSQLFKYLFSFQKSNIFFCFYGFRHHFIVAY